MRQFWLLVVLLGLVTLTCLASGIDWTGSPATIIPSVGCILGISILVLVGMIYAQAQMKAKAQREQERMRQQAQYIADAQPSQNNPAP